MYLETPPRQRIRINAKVKVRVKRHIFRKETPVHHSIWSKAVHIVTKIDESQFPYKYHLSGISKTFYAFQLLLLSPYYPIDESNSMSTIKVVGLEHINAPYLRSGRSLPSRAEIKYKIIKDGQLEYASASDLLTYSRLFGKSILHYADFFKQPENLSYII